MRNKLVLITIIILFCVLLALIVLPVYISERRKANDAQLKSNLHHIQLRLEDYVIDHEDVYPSGILELKEQGYFSDQELGNYFPVNPYNKNLGLMKEIKFGYEPYTGNFTYIPVKIDGQIVGFYLLGYGEENTDGNDVDGDGADDHVIIVVGAFSDKKFKGQMPTLADILRRDE